MMKRRSSNAIRKILHDEKLCTDPGDIKQVFLSHFREFLQQPPSPQIFGLSSLMTRTLHASQNAELQKEFTLTEIELALKLTVKAKAPGPDALMRGFWNCSGRK